MLWSKHDEVNKRFRRYNRPRLVQALARCGLRVERGSYWNCFLFLPILIANDCPGGHRESSLAFQRREGRAKDLSPEGTVERETVRAIYQPSLRDLVWSDIRPS